VKDHEFEGDEQVQKAMKGMLPPLLDGMPSRHNIAPEIGLCPSTMSWLTWLKSLSRIGLAIKQLCYLG
jgi:hypothetical protein